MEHTLNKHLNNQKVLTDTSSAFGLSRGLGVDEVVFTPQKKILNFDQFETLGEWPGHIIVPLEDFWEQPQPDVDRKLVLPLRLTDPLFGREELNQKLQEMATAAPSIEQVWEITERLPSLSKLLSEERDNE